MSIERYVREGVELADGWQIEAEKDGRIWLTGRRFSGTIGALAEPDLAMLVAQLVSQVDETEWKVHVYKDQTIICDRNDREYTIHKGEGRCVNTLKAILDGRVLVMESD